MTQEQPRGRRDGVDSSLRTAAVWSVVAATATARQRELGRPLRIIDLGGGTGGLAVPLAQQGHRVAVVDPSGDALAALRRRAAEAGVADRVVPMQGDAQSLTRMDLVAPVDLLCCHGALEVVDDPRAAIAAISAVLAPGGVLSLVTAGRLAAVLSRALAGAFAQAHRALTSTDGRWGEADPLPRRFDQDVLVEMLGAADFDVEMVQGVRLFSDLVDADVMDREGAREAMLHFEQAVAEHPQYSFLGQLGASLHVLGRKY